MRRICVPLLCLALLPLPSMGCASTSITSAWRDDQFQTGGFKKLFVLGVAKNEGARRMYEDEMVERLAAMGVGADSSARVLPAGGQLTEEALRPVITQGGYDGVLVTHMLGVKQDVRYQPGTTYVGAAHYGGFYRYYPHVYGYVHEPGYYTVHKTVVLETNVYDVAGDKLVWSVQSETFEPDSVERVIDELSTLVTEALAKDRMLAGVDPDQAKKKS